MKKIIQIQILISFLIGFEESNAQNAKIDSLIFRLQNSKEDTNIVNTLNYLARELTITGDYDKAMQHATNALSLSQRIKYRKGEAKSFTEIGVINDEQDQYSEALKNYLTALKMFTELNDKKGIAGSYHNIAIIRSYQANYTDALKNEFESLRIRKEIGDTIGVASSSLTLGVIYADLGDYPESLKNYFTALKIYEEHGRKKAMASSYINIGNIYQYMKNYQFALKNYLAALNINMELGAKKNIMISYNAIGIIYKLQGNYDAALKNYHSALRMGEELGEKNVVGDIYNNIGNVFQDRGDLLEAVENYFVSIEKEKEIGDMEGIARTYVNLGMTNTKLKKYLDAKKHLENALSLSKSIRNNYEIRNSYAALAALDSATGNWKGGYLHYKLYTLYRDSLMNEENTKKILQIQMQYEFSKKEAAIKSENDKQQAIATADLKRQKLIQNSTLGGVSIAGIFSFLLMRSFNRRRKTSFEKQVSEIEMKALRSQMNPHFIFNSLNSVKKYIMENAKNDAAEYLSKFSTLMRMILENSRKQEVTLEKDLSALQLYMELESLRFQNRFQFAIEVDPEIDREDTLIAPLLLQPFVENSIIHGISSKENGLIKVKVSKVENMIKCTVEDNGIGRDQSVQVETGEKKKRESLGMKITQERLKIINQLKKVKTAVTIFDLKDDQNNPGGLRIELLLPFETAF